MGAEAATSFGVDHARAECDELEQMLIPFQPLDRELDADDAVGAHAGRLRAHARHGEFAGVIHRRARGGSGFRQARR